MSTTEEMAHTIQIDAAKETVWSYLTDPFWMKQWMGEELKLEIETNWEVGGYLLIRGVDNFAFLHTCKIFAVKPFKTLRYSYRSSLSRWPDLAQNDAMLWFELNEENETTTIILLISAIQDEIVHRYLEVYWTNALKQLQSIIEKYSNYAIKKAV